MHSQTIDCCLQLLRGEGAESLCKSEILDICNFNVFLSSLPSVALAKEDALIASLPPLGPKAKPPTRRGFC